MVPFENSLPMQLYRALDAIMPDYRALFADFDLTEPQWRVLRVVWEREKVTSQAVAEATLLSPQSLVGIVDRLVAKGLMTRLRSVDDRRMVYLVPTEKGRDLGSDVLPRVNAVRSTIEQRLSAREWATLETLLSKASGEPVQEAEKQRATP